MRFASSAFLALALLLSSCTELQREFQGPARLEVAGVKEGACATVKVGGQSATRCEDYTFRFTGVFGKVPVEVRVEWQGVEVQGYQGEVELRPGGMARVEVARRTVSLRAEAPWASGAATYEAWVDGEWAFGVAAYPDPAPSGLEGMVLVHRGGASFQVPTAPRAVIRVRDRAGEARVEVASPQDGGVVRVPEARYAPIHLTPEEVASRVGCVAAFLGDVERARSCTPPFALAVSPPDGEYREVLLVAYADGLPFQEGRVVARSGESRTVPLARKRVRVELTAPGFTADVQAVGEVWLRGEDQEGVALYGDPSPPGYEGYRLADRAVVVNGVAELSAPTGRMVLFRLVGNRTTAGVVDLLDGDRRVVLP